MITKLIINCSTAKFLSHTPNVSLALMETVEALYQNSKTLNDKVYG